MSLALVELSPRTVLGAGIVLVVLAVVGFAMGESLFAGRNRRRLAGLGDDVATRRAAEAVVAARAALATAIESDDRAARRHPSLGNIASGVAGAGGRSAGGSSAGGVGSATDSIRRDAAREALLDAQRLWESVRPPRDTRARVGLWSGRGRVRSWQLGPIGFERVTIRWDHLVDPNCWVITEYRRPRFGFGLGAESLGLAFFAAGAFSRRLDDLTRALLRGPEFACRPGFAPLRWWRTARRSQLAQAATQAGFADRRLAEPPQPSTTAALWAAVAEDFGPDVAATGLRGLDRPTAVAHTSGPSLLFGAWWGGAPRSVLVAASSHVVWRDPS